MASVVLVDDHPALRAGVASIIERSGKHRVVAEAGTIEEAVTTIRKHSPDIVIVDVSLPDGSGIDLTRSLKRAGSVDRILVLSMHARRGLAESAFESGADGYLLKESTPEYLLHALDEITEGRVFLDNRLRTVGPQERIRAGSRGADSRSADEESIDSLTPREFEIFRFLAAGRSSKQIGVLLHISSKTVDNHRASIMEKLHLASLAELVRLAIRTDTIEP